MTRVVPGVLLCALLCLFAPVKAAPQESAPAGNVNAPATEQHTAAQPFDVNAAVEAYLAKMPAEQRARSNSYYEGGYWLLLWDFLVTMVVMWLLLRFGGRRACAILRNASRVLAHCRRPFTGCNS